MVSAVWVQRGKKQLMVFAIVAVPGDHQIQEDRTVLSFCIAVSSTDAVLPPPSDTPTETVL